MRNEPVPLPDDALQARGAFAAPYAKLARRARLMLLLSLLVLTLPVVVGSVALAAAQRAQRAQITAARLAFAHAVAGQIDIVMLSTTNGVRAIAAQSVLRRQLDSGDRAGAARFLAEVLGNAGFFHSFVILDRDGQAFAAAPSGFAEELAAAARRIAPRDARQRMVGGTPTVVRRQPLAQAGRAGTGATLAAAVSLPRVLEAIQGTRFGRTGFVTVVDRDGNVLLSSDPARFVPRIAAPRLLAMVQEGRSGTVQLAASERGRGELSAVAPLARYPLAVIVSQARDEALAAIPALEQGALLAMLVLVLGGASVSLFSWRAFRAYERRLQLANELLRAVTEGTSDAVFVKDLAGRYLMVNRGGAHGVGRAPEQILGRTDEELFGPTIAAVIRREDQKALDAGAAVTSEFEIDFGDRVRSVSSVRAPYRSREGSVIGVVGVSRDISTLKRTQRTVEELVRKLAGRSAELASSNAELQRFAYVASHDLQEPLRTISGFVQLLAKRYRGQLDAAADEYIGFTVDATQRMQAMIQGILELSRVGSQPIRAEPVDVGEAVRRAQSALGPAIAETGAAIDVEGPLPIVTGDGVQLMRVFQNLIGNALKFCDRGRPQVRIRAQRGEGGWVFAVSDNGIGIPSEHRERVFEMLGRLHTREEYPGTGMGLAIVKRIVERHGGRVWVDSTPGFGSTFRFSIPDGQPAAVEG
jgi:PAS domain S-box-containing protein